MDSENSMDNCALYIFLFLSLLSVGNDFYHVYTGLLESDFMKEKNEKMNNYLTLFKNVLYNNVKKKNNKLIFEEKTKDKKKENKENKNRIKNNEENNNQDNKEIKKETKKKVKEEEKDKKRKKKVKELNENNLLDKKTNNDYEEKINILKKITKKEQ